MENNKRAGWPKTRVSIRFPAGKTFFFLFQNLSIGVEVQPASRLMDKGN